MKKSITIGLQEETLKRLMKVKKMEPRKSFSETVEDIIKLGLSEMNVHLTEEEL